VDQPAALPPPTEPVLAAMSGSVERTAAGALRVHLPSSPSRRSLGSEDEAGPQPPSQQPQQLAPHKFRGVTLLR
jgi:hypothetical protein